MSPGPRPDRLPAGGGSGPSQADSWQALRSFVAGGDGGLREPPGRCADVHEGQGTRAARRLPPTRGRKRLRPAVEARGAVQEGGYGGADSRGAQEEAVADVEAHITGTVWKIECEVGDEIEEGDTVVILESMKMEMPVEAEDTGKVKEILCEEGQSVSEGDVLVVLD